jgi:hypothetical protein
MNEQYRERPAMKIIVAYLMLTCMILLLGSGPSRAEAVDHQGEKVQADDGDACLQCHEEMGAHAHPVITPYPPAGMEKTYLPVAELLRAGIPIRDGRITCRTCHDLNNPEPHHPLRGMDNMQTLPYLPQQMIFDGVAKSRRRSIFVIPAQAGIQELL